MMTDVIRSENLVIKQFVSILVLSTVRDVEMKQEQVESSSHQERIVIIEHPAMFF
jgi:hypothetical protein